MSHFDVIPLNNAVKVEWATGSEAGTSGFMIKRSTPGSTEEFLDYVGDNGFIDADGGVAMGSSYAVTDTRVQNGNTYTYILIEVESSGNKIEQGRKTVTAGIPPTATPLVASGGDTGNSSATATPRATNQATATIQSANGNVNPTATSTTNARPAIVTITPRAPQATATQAANNATTSENSNQNTGAGLGVTEVLAQEETSSTETNTQTAPEGAPILQDSYPGIEATAVPDTSQTYPNNSQPETSINAEAYVGEPTAAPIGQVGNSSIAASPVSVIGSNAGTQPPSGTTDDNTASSNQSRIFLWLGFIVALLIFVTGLVGSILLFTRKSN